MPHLKLSLLGSFRARVDDDPEPHFPSNHVRALLAILAVESDRPHHRSHLAALLWPYHEEARARAYLSHALTHLRKILVRSTDAAPFIHMHGETLQFNRHSDYELDLDAFLHPSDSSADEVITGRIARLQRQVENYRGEFLEGFSLKQNVVFEEWLVFTRERLHRNMLAALQELVDHFTSLDAYADALGYARRIVDMDPWREEAHRQVMLLLWRSDQRAEALRQYEICRRVLSDELQVQPSAETDSLRAQILAGAAPSPPSPTPSRAMRSPLRYSLTAPPTSFIGRAKELDDIRSLLLTPHVRLVTLTGVGGVGKTRIALRCASDLRAQFEDGVFVVSLASIQDDSLVVPTLEHALDIHEQGEVALSRFLANRAMLLVLDNFEHVISAAVEIADLLASCPRLKVLVTSRELLQIQGEHVVHVAPLGLPDLQTLPPLDALLHIPAVRLFVERAQAADNGFALTMQNAETIAHICLHLDGLPLAIELAAARMRLMSPQSVQRALSEGLLTLKSNARDLPERHQTLRGTIDWSYGLLNRREQRLFRRLSIFRGGCSLTAVLEVCQPGVGDESDLLDGLDSLLTKSLLSPVRGGDEIRFSMLEMLRAYGLERLREEDELYVVQRRHAEHFLALAVRAQQSLNTGDQVYWLDLLEDEHDNLRAAMEWAISTGEIELGYRLALALWRFWARRGFDAEAVAWYERLLACDIPRHLASQRVEIMGCMAPMLAAIGRREQARQVTESTIELSRRLGDKRVLGHALGFLATFVHGEEATGLLEEALSLSTEAGDWWNAATVHLTLGHMPLRRRAYAEARAHYQQALCLFRQQGDVVGEAWSQHDLGRLNYLEGHFEDACSAFAASVAGGQQVGYAIGVLSSLIGLALSEIRLGRLTAAQSHLQMCMDTMRPNLFDWCSVMIIEAAAALSSARGNHLNAARLLAAAARLSMEMHHVHTIAEFPDVTALWRDVAQRLSSEGLARAQAEGNALTQEEAIAYALTFT